MIPIQISKNLFNVWNHSRFFVCLFFVGFVLVFFGLDVDYGRQVS